MKQTIQLNFNKLPFSLLLIDSQLDAAIKINKQS